MNIAECPNAQPQSRIGNKVPGSESVSCQRACIVMAVQPADNCASFEISSVSRHERIIHYFAGNGAKEVSWNNQISIRNHRVSMGTEDNEIGWRDFVRLVDGGSDR